jgi:hypothetical protein
MYLFPLDAARNYLLHAVRALQRRAAPSTTVKQEVILKHLRQSLKQRKIKHVRSLSAQDQGVGQAKEARPLEDVGSVKMDQNKPIVIGLAFLIVAGTIGSFGMVIQRWTEWTTSTLINLDKQNAVIEQKLESTNAMIAQNHEMLKALMGSDTQKTYYKVEND